MQRERNFFLHLRSQSIGGIKDMSSKITHDGEVIKVEDDYVHVRIIQKTACSECHAKSACHVSRDNEKIIEIPHTSDVQPGDKVCIVGTASMGLKAVGYAFVLPLILLFAALFFFLRLFNNEAYAIIASLAVMALNYLLYYFMRDKFRTQFVFELVKT